MQRYFYYKFPVSYLIELIFIFILIPAASFSQTKTNLEILYSLNDSLTNRIIREIGGGHKQLELKLNLGKSYPMFSNSIKSNFIKRGYKLVEPVENGLSPVRVNIVMEKAGVEYGDTERDGWFGDYYVKRSVFVEGNYFNSFSDRDLQKYYIEVVDTVKMENINDLENDSFPFTKGKVPAEPFLSSIWEPVIAIGTAAVAVFLFFSVRSK